MEKLQTEKGQPMTDKSCNVTRGRRCLHGRRLCGWCLATTCSFPLEHWLWERAPVLRQLASVMGL
jgi:hypothetical protein